MISIMYQMYLLIAALLLLHDRIAPITAQSYSYDTSNTTGPSNWYKQSGSGMCRTGQSQSPINIVTTLNAQQTALQNIGFSSGLDSTSALVTQQPTFTPISANNYSTATTASSSDTVTLINNGNTLNASFSIQQSNRSPNVTYNGITYFLTSALFHSSSEHTLNQQSADMEIQLVHTSNNGDLLAMAVFMVMPYTNNIAPNDGASPFLSSISWTSSQLPINTGNSTTFPLSSVALSSLIPTANTSYFAYTGSLTTPPCSQPVQWLLYQQPVNISLTQKLAFTDLFGPSTDRPLQNVNGRNVQYYIEPVPNPVSLATNPVADQLLATILLSIVGVASFMLFISRDLRGYARLSKEFGLYVFNQFRPSSMERQFHNSTLSGNRQEQYAYADSSNDTSFTGDAEQTGEQEPNGHMHHRRQSSLGEL